MNGEPRHGPLDCAKTPIVKRHAISSCTEHYMWVGSYANMLTPPGYIFSLPDERMNSAAALSTRDREVGFVLPLAGCTSNNRADYMLRTIQIYKQGDVGTRWYDRIAVDNTRIFPVGGGDTTPPSTPGSFTVQ